jgi:hypothetical protein
MYVYFLVSQNVSFRDVGDALSARLWCTMEPVKANPAATATLKGLVRNGLNPGRPRVGKSQPSPSLPPLEKVEPTNTPPNPSFWGAWLLDEQPLNLSPRSPSQLADHQARFGTFQGRDGTKTRWSAKRFVTKTGVVYAACVTRLLWQDEVTLTSA